MPVLAIGPWDLDCPEECSLGVNPTNEPIVFPVNRPQSPISTARAKPVRVEIPRRHPSRCTTGVNSLSAAIPAISVSNRARRSVTIVTVS